MDRLVEIKVQCGTALADSKFIGVVGDALITAMRVTFDAGWDGYAKTLYMWDARGQHPVAVILGANLLQDALVPNVYLVKIPAEPLTLAGDGVTAVFEGVKEEDGVTSVQRTENLYFTVLEASVAQGADAPADVTPTQAAQLQSEIEAILPDLQEDVAAAYSAQTAAEEARGVAVSAKDEALAAALTSVAARDDAIEAKAAVEAMMATVTSLPAGSAPTVTKTTAEGVTNLAFAIPEGERGEQGYYVAEVAKKSGTGTPGSVDTYALKLNDAAESEIGTFTVRNGADGEGAGDMLMSVYDQDGDGAVDNAEKLGGELPAYYAAASALTAHTARTDNPHGVTAAQAGAAAASHTHAASAITSGTLPVSRGGTGQTSVDTTPTSGSSKMVTSGGVYLEIATLSVTKMSKTTITASANASPALGTIANNHEYRCTNASLTTAPTLTIPAIASTDTEFVAFVIFKAPNTAAPAVTNSSGYTLKYQGDGVSGGVFTPVAGTVYTMAIVFDGICMNVIVSGVA